MMNASRMPAWLLYYDEYVCSFSASVAYYVPALLYVTQFPFSQDSVNAQAYTLVVQIHKYKRSFHKLASYVLKFRTSDC